MSYSNMMLYSSVLPSYNSSDDDKKNGDEIINADDPKNKDKVRSLIFG